MIELELDVRDGDLALYEYNFDKSIKNYYTGYEFYSFLKYIMSNTLISLNINKGSDIILNFKGFTLKINNYETVLLRPELFELYDFINTFQYEEAKINLKNKKVKRQNKYKNCAIKVTLSIALILLLVELCILVNSKPGETIDVPDETTAIAVDTPTTPDTTTIVDIDEDPVIKLNYQDRSDTDDSFLNIKNKYGQIIEKYAKMYGLDPNLVVAIAAQESGDSHKIDNGPAMGLMQIEKSVWANERLAVHNFSTNETERITVDVDKLTQLEYNIKIGCMILRNSMNNFDYNILLGIQGYNKGVDAQKIIIEAYASSNNKSKDEVINNSEDIGWMEYRSAANGGDNNYLENVFSRLGSRVETFVYKSDGTKVSICVENQKTKYIN